MKSLVDHLSQYAAYHRDPRNIASHFIGIPLIVVAVAVLLSRPEWSMGGLWLSPAVLLALFSAWFYLRLELALGVLMTVLMGLSVWAGHVLAAQSTAVWLSSGAGMFVVGWVIQFVGHYYEGRKPAFVDDVSGLIVGRCLWWRSWRFCWGCGRTSSARLKSVLGRWEYAGKTPRSNKY